MEENLYRIATDHDDHPILQPHYPAPPVIVQGAASKELEEIVSNGVVVIAPRADMTNPEMEEYIDGYLQHMAAVKRQTGKIPEWTPQEE